MLNGVKRLARTSYRHDERGVALIVIVIGLIVAAGALIATRVMMRETGALESTKATSAATNDINNAILSYFIRDPDGAGAATAPNAIPCPDSDRDGDADGTPGACTTNAGTLPWSTLNLSPDDAIDSEGNYFTFVVSPTGQNVCHSVTNDYDNTQKEFTGTLIPITDTNARLSTETTVDGDTFYYALISHGENGLGAISRSGAMRTAPTGSAEIENCPASNTNCSDADPLNIITGPYNTDATVSTGYFDDNVFIGSVDDLTPLCEQLTPAKKLNAFINESFTASDAANADGLPSSLDDSGGGSTNVALASGSTSDYVLQFSGNDSAVTTNSTNFSPGERPLYISFEWRPTSGSEAGISIATRATAADRGSGASEDIFSSGTDDGITIRYYEDGNAANGVATHRVYICDQTTTTQCDNDVGDSLASSGSDTFTISLNQAYTVEAYDDGVKIWARITQNSSPSNGAVVFLNSIATVANQDLDTPNSILLINHGNSTSEIDDLLVGRGVMAATFDGVDDIAATAGSNHDTATGDLSIEAWIRPDNLPGGSSQAALVSKWISGDNDNSHQAYRLYIASSGLLTLQIAGDDAAVGTTYIVETLSLGIRPTPDKWQHIAVTYDASDRRAYSYLNGSLSASVSATSISTAGLNGSGTTTGRFTVGAEFNTGSAVVNPYDGDIADVRVWNTPRSSTEVSANDKARLSFITDSTLIVNWTLDRDSLQDFSSTTAASSTGDDNTSGTNGTLAGGAVYIGALQQYIHPFSDSGSICPSGSRVTPYQCDFRAATTATVIAIPNNLHSVYVKAWGAGGGGYDHSAFESSGGGGGYSRGRIRAIQTSTGSTIVSGLTSRITVGGGGTASGDDNNGAGGGGASGYWRDPGGTTNDRAGVTAGGGGGSGFIYDAGADVEDGAAGSAPAPGGTTDPDYAPSYCNGTNCITTVGRGGEPNVNTAGRIGAVVLKW